MKLKELLTTKAEDTGKTIPCSMVLRLMDSTEYSYEYCVRMTLDVFVEVNREELERELDKYV